MPFPGSIDALVDRRLEYDAAYQYSQNDGQAEANAPEETPQRASAPPWPARLVQGKDRLIGSLNTRRWLRKHVNHRFARAAFQDRSPPRLASLSSPSRDHTEDYILSWQAGPLAIRRPMRRRISR